MHRFLGLSGVASTAISLVRTISWVPAFVFSWATTSALSAGIPVNDARMVAYLCSAGMSTQVQGEVDAAIARVLGVGEVSGKATLDLADLKGVLEHFADDTTKKEVYQTFTKCVTSLIHGLRESRPIDQQSNLDEDSRLLAPDPLTTVKRGQRFAMKVGENRLLTENEVLMRLTKIDDRIVYFNFSYATGDKSKYMGIGQNTPLPTTDCRVEVYGADKKTQKASFRMLCPK